MEWIERAYDVLFIGCSVYLAITIFICLLRAIAGPRLTDRLVAVNIISCKVVILFAVLAVYMDEHYLLDICITYALISFLAIVVLSKVLLSGMEPRDFDQKLNMGKQLKGEENP